jgi:hypothetical protein
MTPRNGEDLNRKIFSTLCALTGADNEDHDETQAEMLALHTIMSLIQADRDRAVREAVIGELEYITMEWDMENPLGYWIEDRLAKLKQEGSEE